MTEHDARARPVGYDTVHVPAKNHRDALVSELEQRSSEIVAETGNLVFSRGKAGSAAWAQNSWLSPAEYAIDSIGDAARLLRSIQRNWHLHSVACHRRARLVADKLPRIRFRALDFPATIPTAPLGVFCLLGRHRPLASPVCSSAFPDGRPVFNEDRHGPPNRAYLKLWEALTLAGCRPHKGSHCLDLGASPGGWTWVLDQLGSTVTAVDRAPLMPGLQACPRITTIQRDAFKLTLDDLETPPAWILSDVIAYPERLFDLTRYWCGACPEANVILTVKCQGPVDPAMIDRFRDISDSHLQHLAANKHELTFFRLPGRFRSAPVPDRRPGWRRMSACLCDKCRLFRLSGQGCIGQHRQTGGCGCQMGLSARGIVVPRQRQTPDMD